MRRATEESNLEPGFWRPRCYRYTSRPGRGIVGDSVRLSCEHTFVPWKPPDAYSYAYLLGAYLGDGYLSRAGQLLIVCDRKYVALLEEHVGPKT